MIFLKYVGSLAAAVFFAVYAIFFMPFVTQGAVVAGAVQQDHMTFQLVFETSSGHLPLGPEQVHFLNEHMRLLAQGSARVLAASVNVTPTTVSVIRGVSRLLVPGATLAFDLKWDTPPDSLEGATGQIWLDLPQVPGLEGAKPVMTLGGDLTGKSGPYLIRAESAYRNPLRLALGRLFLALSLGLPVAMLLHAVGWYFLVLRRERRSRIAALPAQGPTGILPRSFFPDPIAEWRAGIVVIAVFALAASFFAYSSTGLVNYPFIYFAYILVAASIPVAAAVADYTAATVLNLRVELRGLSLARGRRHLQWRVIPWEDITGFRERYRRGRSWVELAFASQRRTLRITDSAIMDYAGLCASVKQCWRAPEGRPG